MYFLPEPTAQQNNRIKTFLVFMVFRNSSVFFSALLPKLKFPVHRLIEPVKQYVRMFIPSGLVTCSLYRNGAACVAKLFITFIIWNKVHKLNCYLTLQCPPEYGDNSSFLLITESQLPDLSIQPTFKNDYIGISQQGNRIQNDYDSSFQPDGFYNYSQPSYAPSCGRF